TSLAWRQRARGVERRLLSLARKIPKRCQKDCGLQPAVDAKLREAETVVPERGEAFRRLRPPACRTFVSTQLWSDRAEPPRPKPEALAGIITD
ncbi:unnamed protein product, partial [Hapterophycus canaliculatus]